MIGTKGCFTAARLRRPRFRQLLPLVAALLALWAPQAGFGATCPPNVFPGVNPASLTDPQAGLPNLYTFNNPVLDGNALQKFVTPVPNALTPGFIYTPNGTQGGETLYTVSMKEITQSLGLIYLNPLDPVNNGCTAAPNTLWAYGDARGAAAPTAPHSVPGPTFEATSNVPHRILWTNELPDLDPRHHPANVDPTLDCGPNAPGCAPYNRVVPHVHGAHVADDSDGNPDQWFTPGFLKTGHNWQPNTHIPGATVGTYRYENTQEAGTIWYHDHAMGLTHLNVFAGLAGFHIIRDANETALQSPPAGGGLATLPKYPFENLLAIQDRVFDTNGRLYAPDRPIQDANATLANVACDPTLPTTVTPANPVVSPYACTPANLVGGSGTILLPTTPCDPAASIVAPVSPYACPVKYFTTNPDGSLNEIPTGTAPPAGAVTFPSITNEYWGNVLMVNGQVWPKQDVEKRVYRFRWLNGSDSRTYVLRLVDATTKLPIPGVDIWQIGTEQGFLNAPIKVTVNDPTAVNPPATPPFPQINGITIMPGERVDVLVDFTNVPAGTQVLLQNLGPDAPYTGEYPVSAANGQTPTAIVPEVMLLNVVATYTTTIPNTLAPTAIASLRAPVVPLATTPGAPVRTIYLAERVDRFGRLALTLNGVDYMTAIDQFVKLGDTEEWDVVNLTPDGHPMHPHLVAFQLINRQELIDPATGLPFAPPALLPLIGTTVAAQYNGLGGNPALPTATGVLTPPDPNEAAAWKDTIFMPPGKVTRIKAKFDIPGLYVFHCHILSHEENDMMRAFAVATPAASVTASAIPATRLSGSTGAVEIFAAAKTGIANYSDSNAFEYQFSVTTPAGVTTALAPMTMVPPTTTPGYTMMRTVSWTPPSVPGTYLITVNAKPMGQAPTTANMATTTLKYVIDAPAVSGVTSTTPAGSYRAGSTVNVTLSFNQAISSTGLAVTLNNGVTLNTGALTNATSYSGSFTVAAGQDTPGGGFLNVSGIGGTIKDAANNPTLNPAPPAGANLANNVPIVIDTVAPRSVSTVPAGTYVGSVTVSLAASEPGSIYYSTDGSTPTTASALYTGPILLTSPTTATISLKFFAVDQAGNAETPVNSIAYGLHTLDLAGSVTINGGQGYTSQVNATLTLSASDSAGVAAYAISTDNVNYLPTVTINPALPSFSAANLPVTLPGGDGVKTVYVKFTDGLGVVYPPVTAQIVLDSAPPAVSGATSSTGSGFYKAGSVVNVTLSFTEPVTSPGLTIALNNGASIATGPLTNATMIYSGSFTVALGQETPAGGFLDIGSIVGTLTDRAGNLSANPTLAAGTNISSRVQVTTDTVAPVSAATVPAGTYSGMVAVGLSANEAATIHYTTDGTTPTAASPIYVGPFPLGANATTTFTVQFFAVDRAGNVETPVKSAAYTIHIADLTAKVALNNGKPYTNSVNVTLSLSASDKYGVTSYAISTDNASYLPTVTINPALPVFSANNIPVTLPAGDGLKTVYVKFTDALGVVYAPVSAQITLQTATPGVTISPAPGDYADKITVSLQGSAGSAKIYYTTNGKSPTTGSPIYKGPFQLSGRGKSVTVQYLAVDQAGNAGPVQSAVYRFVAVPDMTASVSVNNGAVYTDSRNVLLMLSAQDTIGGGVATMSFSNDGITFTAPVPYAATAAMPWTLPAGDGMKTVYFRFTDVGTPGVAPITYTFTDKIILAEGVVASTGDLDGDGKVDLVDVQLALKASSGLRKLTVPEQARSDVGPLKKGKPMPDGAITAGDVLVITQKLVGLVTF